MSISMVSPCSAYLFLVSIRILLLGTYDKKREQTKLYSSPLLNFVLYSIWWLVASMRFVHHINVERLSWCGIQVWSIFFNLFLVFLEDLVFVEPKKYNHSFELQSTNCIWRDTGYIIPKGWKALVWFRSVHLDPEIYPNPKEFNPYRWNVSCQASSFNYSELSPCILHLYMCFIV